MARWRNTAVLSFAALWLVQGLQAATLGDIRVLSALGDRFSAQIPVGLVPGEEISGNCFRLVRPVGAADDATTILGAASLRLLPVSDDLAILQIRSEESIQDPLLKLAIRLRCPGAEMHAFHREYSVLLDPRDYSSYVVQEALPSSRVLASPKMSSAKTGADRKRTLPARGGTWLTREGDTVNAIARSYVSGAGKARQDFIQRLYDLNPDLPQSANASLGIDIPVRIPEQIEQSASERFAPSVTPRPAVPPPPKTEERPSLSLGSSAVPTDAAVRSDSGNYALQLSAPVLGQGGGKLSPEQALLLREQLLALDSDDQAAQTLQLKYQVSQLQKQLAEIRQRQALADEGQAEPPKLASSGLRYWLWIPLLLVVSFPLAFLYWRRRQIREQANSDAFSSATMTSAMSRLPTKPVERGEMNTQMPDYVSLSGFDIDEIAVPVHRPAGDDWQADSSQMDVVQPGNVGEEAQLLLDHGLSQQAINLLVHEIQAYPAALALWMKLFAVYVQQGMKDAFQERAVAFRLQFSSDSLWQQVQEMGRQIDAANPLYRSLDVHQEEHFSMLQANSTAPLQEPADMGDALFASAMHDQAGLPRPAETILLGAARPSVSDDMALEFSLDLAVEQELTASPVPDAQDEPVLDFLGEAENRPPVFVSDDPAMQDIARLLAAGERDEAMSRLELMLYKGTMEQKLQAAKWVDLLAPLLPPGQLNE